jgi:hypothetical protein
MGIISWHLTSKVCTQKIRSKISKGAMKLTTNEIDGMLEGDFPKN